MITVARAHHMASYRKSMYESMIESTSIEERANAEAPRLSFYAWYQIVHLLATPLDPNFNDEVQKVIADIIERWQRYCLTGIPVDDTANAVKDMQKKMIESFRPAPIETPTLPAQVEQVVEGKKGKKLKPLEEPKQLEEALPVDQEILDVLNPNAINMYIDEIAEEVLGERTSYIEMRDKLIEDARRVDEAISPPPSIYAIPWSLPD